MTIGRREFLKAAGVATLGVASGAFELVAGDAVAAESGHGVRWAMVVDPLRCSKAGACTACIDACNRAHNVPSIPDPRHEVKWIWKEPFADAFPGQDGNVDETLTAGRVMVLCNHCDNPPCVRVCPTQSTWRRPDGVVMMDWHRCIGCRYCMAACPYGSRSFNWQDPRPFLANPNPDFPTRTKGVVEKCTLCAERLDRGESPLCVAACPQKALVFGNLYDPSSGVRAVLRSRYALRRRAELGTRPEVYYLV
jgi:[DsrC]-trisulfide reductase subunit O